MTKAIINALLALLAFGLTGCLRVTPRLVDGGAFCPSAPAEPPGGRDFLGAVHVVVTVNLRPSSDGRQIVASVTMLAENNATTAPQVRDTFPDTVVYTLPRSRAGRITAIEPSSGRAEGVTSAAGPEFGVCNEGDVFTGPGALDVSGVIERIEVIGDTGHDDISPDQNCRCDTQIRSLILRPVRLTVE